MTRLDTVWDEITQYLVHVSRRAIGLRVRDSVFETAQEHVHRRVDMIARRAIRLEHRPLQTHSLEGGDE